MLFLLSGFGEMVNSFRRSTIAQNIGGVVVNAAAMFTPPGKWVEGIVVSFVPGDAAGEPW
jgi:hypothetical protein